MPYSQSVRIKRSVQLVFDAITHHVQDWWGNSDTGISRVGNICTTRFDRTCWIFQITSYAPNTHLEWTCIDANHIHEGYAAIEKE